MNIYPIVILYSHLYKYAIVIFIFKRNFGFYVEYSISVTPVLKVSRRVFIYEKNKAFSK